MLKVIISGGQTGADMGGLLAGKELGLYTGGWAPKGWKTEKGPNLELRDKFRLLEHSSTYYPHRTEQNVIDSNATLIFGNAGEGGTALTISLCKKHKKPYKHIFWTKGFNVTTNIEEFKQYDCLNIAGNRESKNPGIEQFVRNFLVECLK